ncbi:MAG: LemA family protein [Ruminococcaceae bacterium]|nr:LemA family protein [Oscillospiraceae bacterium]
MVIISTIASAISSYNSMVSKQQTVDKAWSDISIQLQRRAELIPNFVSTVKGYSDYEQETLTAVTEARTKFLNADSVNEGVAAGEEMSSALSVWVNAVTEAYPELKANTQFTALTDELSGTENRIAVARRDYNEKALDYNTSIKKFPRNIFAGIFGFEAYDYFEASESAQNVPEVSFD